MKIHEYQGKEILRKYGVPTPRGVAAFSVEEAVEAAKKLGAKVWAVKAPIPAGRLRKAARVTGHTSPADPAEITPLVNTNPNRVVGVAGKINIDGNALVRPAGLVAMRDLDGEDPCEVEASKYVRN